MGPDAQIRLIVIIGTIILLFLLASAAAIVLYYQRQQLRYQQELRERAHIYQLLQTKVEVQDQTLQLFGQELHDNIGQLLTTAKMFFALAEQSAAPISASFTTGMQTLSQAIKELRSLSKSFNKEWLNQFNLYDNLKREVERINSSPRIHITLNASNGTIGLSSDAQIMVFRVIQEAIQNSIKHSQATGIVITMVAETLALRINIIDDGIGFHLNQTRNEGVGMLNMRRRIELLKGSIEWLSEDSGTEVRITVPLS